MRLTALCAAAALAACSSPVRHQPVRHQTVALVSSCEQHATVIISQNVDAVAAHRYAAASAAAEQAARVSLGCSAQDQAPDARFSDRWRAANALVVAAELAHQAKQPKRAAVLLAQGYRIMHELRAPSHVSALTSTLISQMQNGAERDMRGQWSYW